MYRAIVLFFTIIAPTLSISIAYYGGGGLFFSIEKWFMIFAVGARLFAAGCRQLLQPQFTLHHIFGIQDRKGMQLVQEVGLHNSIVGAVTMSVYLNELSYAFVMCIITFFYFMGAGILHACKKEKSSNQRIAMVSDFFIATVAMVFIGARIYIDRW